MLTYLSVRDLILVDKLDISFGAGFNVLTGETGAGKSMVTDALLLLLGGKLKGSVVRSGKEKAVVQGTFNIDKKNSSLHRALNDSAIALENGTELIIKREIGSDNRSRAFANGQQITMASLRSLGDLLVDFHGQHDNESLTKTETQLSLLDDFGGLVSLRKEYAMLFMEWKETERALDMLVVRNKKIREESDMLSLRLRELKEANVRFGEEEQLLAKIRRIEGGQKLIELRRELRECLDDRLLPSLRETQKLFERLIAIDALYDERGKMVCEALSLVKEAASAIKFDYDDESDENIDALNDSLAKINRLKRKYQQDEGGLVSLLAETEKALLSLANGGTEEDELRIKADNLRESVLSKGKGLSSQRKKAAELFSRGVIKNLKLLNMEKTEFRIKFIDREFPSESGIDKIEFVFSANPGEEVKNLADTASGGELARLMLSIRVVTAERDLVPVLVFDEIDAGIGGETSEMVGKMLKKVGINRQVFSVTHSHQIAKEAEHHFSVVKRNIGTATVVRVIELDYEERVEELARMLGGAEKIAAVEHAKKLLS